MQRHVHFLFTFYEHHARWIFEWIRAKKRTFTEDTQRRITTVTSSLKEISTDQLGNIVVVRVGGVTPPAPNPCYSTVGAWTDFERRQVNSLTFFSDIFFMEHCTTHTMIFFLLFQIGKTIFITHFYILFLRTSFTYWPCIKKNTISDAYIRDTYSMITYRAWLSGARIS